MRTDFTQALDYAGYLHLDTLLAAQHPLSDPQHPDELLFVIQHQTTELWLKLMVHELVGARGFLDTDDLARARKSLSRVKHILRTVTEQWSVLATLTPSEYAEFRDVLGPASGFQSVQYRAVEFLLGNKNPGMLKVFEANPPAHAFLSDALHGHTVYDAFLRLVARRGLPVPAAVLERDVSKPWVEQPELIPVFREIYEDTTGRWDLYETSEDLVDLEDAFQLWRFRHLRTVQRTIGYKHGTGGSSGVSFLKRALDLTFFPELIAVRTEIGVP
ncbi:tryptophan 2,3-dioxygenase [Nocardioides humilatus]|uniref:Tryptophan 2,3-dioxygenase n=2 Tax=Nocardioides humilatus TaxID=2607660 RepID=A0A5B1LNF3_9ACTN|nr:tryptophan 2,3-dioxygenase [Nocardioides humilatus]